VDSEELAGRLAESVVWQCQKETEARITAKIVKNAIGGRSRGNAARKTHRTHPSRSPSPHLAARQKEPEKVYS
jgi:hypothetical protein